jgi:DNA-binding XRE family transcriptional regulator
VNQPKVGTVKRCDLKSTRLRGRGVHAECIVDICVKVGRKIRYLRTQKGIHQVDLAATANIKRETLSRIENGRIEVGIRTLGRIADALGVKITVLFEDNHRKSET